MLFRLCAGGKKRKKKVYTTPKKIKHKRKKVKLAVLKYYKVDGDGKIERLRRECPQPEVRCQLSRVSCRHINYFCSAALEFLWPLWKIDNTAVTAISLMYLTTKNKCNNVLSVWPTCCKGMNS